MAAPTSLTQLRIVHVALVASSLVITGVLWWVRGTPGAAPPASPVTAMILYVGLAVGALALAVGMAAWKTISPYESPADLKAWLNSVAPRMVVTWGLCEGAAVVGGVTYFMTGSTVACGTLAAAAIVAVILHSPGRLGLG